MWRVTTLSFVVVLTAIAYTNQAVLDGPWGTLASLFFLPFSLLFGFIFTDLLGDLEGGGAIVVLLISGAFSWAVWVTLSSRLFKALGLWSPFNNAWRGRRLVFQSIIRARDWSEALNRFGKGPTSEWASFFEALANRFRHGQIFLGRPKLPIGGLLRPVGIPTEKHMVTIAGTGAGKSTAALIPNLCLHKGSLLCVDPKGELATITAGRRAHGDSGCKGLGQKVRVVDPFGISGWDSACYNVFDEMEAVARLDKDRPVSYAGKIAEALVKTLNQKDSYWDNAAQTFIRGLILYIFTQEPKERRNLVRLRQLLLQGDVETYEEAVESGVINGGDLDPFDVLLEAMKACRDDEYGEAIAGTASSVLMMGPNQRGAVLTTAQEHTTFLDVPELRRISTKSDFLLEDLKKERISVYLCLPINAISGKEGRWLRMFVLLLIDMMMRVQKAPKPPILLAIDEFPSLGRLDGIEVVAPVLRSYGVRFWAIGQDIEQFEKVYPECWGGFIGGAEAVQFMGITHPQTVEFISTLLGTHIVQIPLPPEEIWHKGQKVGGGPKYKDVEAPLLDADQVSRFLSKEKNNQIIWRGSKRPMVLKTAPYYWYMPWWFYAPDPRFKEKRNRSFWRSLFGGFQTTGPRKAVGSPSWITKQNFTRGALTICVVAALSAVLLLPDWGGRLTQIAAGRDNSSLAGLLQSRGLPAFYVGEIGNGHAVFTMNLKGAEWASETELRFTYLIRYVNDGKTYSDRGSGTMRVDRGEVEFSNLDAATARVGRGGSIIIESRTNESGSAWRVESR